MAYWLTPICSQYLNNNGHFNILLLPGTLFYTISPWNNAKINIFINYDSSSSSFIYYDSLVLDPPSDIYEYEAYQFKFYN
mgnify:CR=1 FL=1